MWAPPRTMYRAVKRPDAGSSFRFAWIIRHLHSNSLCVPFQNVSKFRVSTQWLFRLFVPIEMRLPNRLHAGKSSVTFRDTSDCIVQDYMTRHVSLSLSFSPSLSVDADM